MNRSNWPFSPESPFLDEELLLPEAPQAGERPVVSLLRETPFHVLEIEQFEEDNEVLELESDESTYYEDGPEKKLEREQEEPVQPEEWMEQHEGGSTASITRDFSLKGLANGTVGAVPNAIREDVLSGRNRDLWNVTNRVFWNKHPHLTDTPLNPKDPKQKKLVAEYGRMASDVRALLWLTQIVELLDKHRGDLPREFLLGWMAQESDGKVGVTTSLGERGYFQIHPSEAKHQLGLTDSTFRRVSTDREFSIKQGIRLVQAFRTHMTSNFPVADSSELLWKLTKARHGLPGLLNSTLDAIQKSGKPIEWDVVTAKMRAAGDRGVVNNVEKTMGYAADLKPLSDLIPAASTAPTPEVTEEQEFLDEETGVIGNDDRTRVKNTFQIPYQWIVRVALRKGGKEVDYGTGFLVSDRHVLTAAHVIEKAAKDSSMYDISVKIAFNWDTDLGEFVGKNPRIATQYKTMSSASPYDYGLLTLSGSPGAKKLSKLKNRVLGHFARGSVSAQNIQGATGHTAGYPTEKDRLARKMWEASGRLRFTGDRPLDAAPFLNYSGDTTKGQSGSPVWIQDSGGMQLIGMAIVAGERSNTVLRLTDAVWTQIDAWMSEQQNELEEYEDVHKHEPENSDPEYELEGEAPLLDEAEVEDEAEVGDEVEGTYEPFPEAEVPEFHREAPKMTKTVTARPGAAGVVVDVCAERRTINDTQALKEPFPRPCCALHPTIVGDQALRVEDASPHFYGENKYPADEKSGYIYTCRGGFIDLGHSRDWLDWTGYLAVHAKALLPGGGTLELTCENDSSTRTIEFKPQGAKRSDEICVYLAQRIAYELAVWHEIVTALLGHRYSAFSPEDNYSNLAGTYMGRDALLTFRKRPFNEAAGLAIKHWLNKLGAVTQTETRAAFAAVKDVWWKDIPLPPLPSRLNQLLLTRHFDALGTVTPMLVPGMCASNTPLPLPVPKIVKTPIRTGVLVKTDLTKLYVLQLGIGPSMATKLAGTSFAGKSQVTSDDFADLIAHAKTFL